MGLDMYLEGNKFLWTNYGDESKCPRKVVGKCFPSVQGTPSNVTFEVGYWRKANAIHKWFVDNVQGGEDKCNKFPVYEEHLYALREACEKAIAGDHDALPTQGGFFFGGTEYDEWYYKNLKYTLEVIKNGMEFLEKHGELYYYSSW